MSDGPPVPLAGDDVTVPCIDGTEVRYCPLDSAASTGAFPAVVDAVTEFLPWYSSVHRGAGYKSQVATEAYENSRTSALSFAGHEPDDGYVAVLCRNTTEAINHIAYRLRLEPTDVVCTTVVEHHANLLPWQRVARQRWVECDPSGMFSGDDVVAALRPTPRPTLLAITGASNVTGWLPPLDAIIDAAHSEGVPVLVDAAQLAPHHPLPGTADFIAWSGHKVYAPFGASVFVGPRDTFTEGDPFLAGGGAVELVDLDEVVWTDPPEREEAGSPNVVGAVALHKATDELKAIGWEAIARHEKRLGRAMRRGLAAIDGVRLLGPSPDVDTLAIATFLVDGASHALVAARLSAEFGIGVRHGCFCAHPYLIRLLGLDRHEVEAYREDVKRGDHRRMPGAVRASAGINTIDDDIDRLLGAVAVIASGAPAPVAYEQDPTTGDYWPLGGAHGWSDRRRALGARCSRG